MSVALDVKSPSQVQASFNTDIRLIPGLLLAFAIAVVSQVIDDNSIAPAMLLALSIAATIGFGLFLARLVGFQNRFAAPTAGAVAICGAPAAIAIASVLPTDEKAEDRLVFAIAMVTGQTVFIALFVADGMMILASG